MVVSKKNMYVPAVAFWMLCVAPLDCLEKTVEVEAWQSELCSVAAASGDNVERVAVLVKQIKSERGTIDAQSRGVGYTALLYAAANQNHKIAEMLLQHGADVDRRAFFDGMSPLMLAARFGDNNMVEILIKACANPFLIDKRGLKASDWAKTGALKERLLEFEKKYPVA